MSGRVLYHFQQSVFSRRTRLALAHKGIAVELRDGREDPKHLAAARALGPIRTMPVFVEEDGRALGDSGAIVQYLDLAYPDRPALVPAAHAHAALAIMTAVDVAMNALVDLGTRTFELRNDPAWGAMKEERLARAKDAIDFVAAKATRPYLAGDTWSAADVWAYSAAVWVAAFPGRVATSPAVANIVTLGFELPEPLVLWTKQHAGRADVRSIYG
ncbi:MAG: glutathione S-transferase family protein [Labilithrix sp.]|nr:glutathione S-transferase family protein [Labilithrix sp.]MCW5809524.1 glutathione S-transferase family protein [Labilithrix sp.]